jgi:formate dehydrogenase major subunit
MTNSFYEMEKADTLILIGSNITEAHPVASTFVKRAKYRNGATLIVVDPRRTGIAEHADLHVPIKVGSDVAFINGLMHIILREGWQDQKFIDNCTVDFDKVKKVIANYPPQKAAEIAGIPVEMLEETARLVAAGKPTMLLYTLGITEHTCGVNNVMSTANLQMMLGNMGRESGGVNPLRGQNNVQGACDMAALPNVYPGYQKVGDPAVQEKFEKFWGVEKLNDKIGLQIPAMMSGMVDGSVRAFYCFGENMANTEPDIHHTERCLESVEFLICQDIFMNETTRFADVVFPSAAWSEDDGTFTNSERRVNRVRKVVDPPGNARPNWWIFKELAKRLGQDWASSSGQEIWDNEIAVCTPSMMGVKYARIEADGLQWPCPSEDHPGTTCLHKDGDFTCGLGIFHAIEWTPPAEVPDDDFPLVLTSGRRLTHYHTRTQTGRCEGLNDILPEEYLEINPADATARGLAHGDMARAFSRRGETEVRAWVTDRVPQGTVFMAFHFRDGNANWLTNPVYDPVSGTAEYKACAIEVQKVA